VIDAEGKVRLKSVGNPGDEVLEKQIDALVAEAERIMDEGIDAVLADADEGAEAEAAAARAELLAEQGTDVNHTSVRIERIRGIAEPTAADSA